MFQKPTLLEMPVRNALYSVDVVRLTFFLKDSEGACALGKCWSGEHSLAEGLCSRMNLALVMITILEYQLANGCWWVCVFLFRQGKGTEVTFLFPFLACFGHEHNLSS